MRDATSSGFLAGLALADVEIIAGAGAVRRFKRSHALIRSEWPATRLFLMQRRGATPMVPWSYATKEPLLDTPNGATSTQYRVVFSERAPSRQACT